MKYSYLMLTVLMIIMTATITAHSPSSLDWSFDAETRVLELSFQHSVGNPNNHYIRELSITHNDKEIIIHKLSNQDDKQGILFKYRIPDIEAGMTLKITAICNRSGRLVRDINIE